MWQIRKRRAERDAEWCLGLFLAAALPRGAPHSESVGAVLFAQGQGLMFVISSNNKGLIDAANPRFEYSFHRFPGATTATETTTQLNLLQAISVNAHASAQKQTAAQTFVDFLARPKQNELFARATGGLTQYEFVKGQLPDYMSSFAKLFAERSLPSRPTRTSRFSR